MFSFLVFSTSFTVNALECRTERLTCSHFRLNDVGGYHLVKTESASFIGVNNDEPSLPANECVLDLSFKSSVNNQNLHVTLYDDLTTYFYVGVDYGALNPQFQLEASLNKEMSLTTKTEKMTCVLNK